METKDANKSSRLWIACQGCNKMIEVPSHSENCDDCGFGIEKSLDAVHKKIGFHKKSIKIIFQDAKKELGQLRGAVEKHIGAEHKRLHKDLKKIPKSEVEARGEVCKKATADVADYIAKMQDRVDQVQLTATQRVEAIINQMNQEVKTEDTQVFDSNELLESLKDTKALPKIDRSKKALDDFNKKQKRTTLIAYIGILVSLFVAMFDNPLCQGIAFFGCLAYTLMLPIVNDWLLANTWLNDLTIRCLRSVFLMAIVTSIIIYTFPILTQTT